MVQQKIRIIIRNPAERPFIVYEQHGILVPVVDEHAAIRAFEARGRYLAAILEGQPARNLIGLHLHDDIDIIFVFQTVFEHFKLQGADGAYNVGFRTSASLLEQLNQEYTELIQAAVQKFYKGGGERGILNIDGNAVSKNYGTKEDGTPRTFNDVYNEMVNKQFANYFKSPNAVMTLWSGFEYNSRSSDASKKSTSDVKDITDLTDEIYEKVACALQIPPALLKGDIADVRELTKNFLTFSVDPLAKMMEREINRKRNGTEVLRGNYIAIDTSTVQHIEPFDVAEAVDKLRAASVLNVDEIRKRIGEPEIGQPWSREYVMTKNYSGVDPPEEGGTE